MKKFLLFASAVAVLFSSCSTDKTEDLAGIEANGTIKASAAYQQEATRTYLEGTDVLWSKGDALGVFGKSGVLTQYGLTAGEGTTDGTFNGNSNFLKVGEPVYAFYPYDKDATISDAKVTLKVMDKQTFYAENTFDAAQAPAVGLIEALEDKTNIDVTLKGVASYLAVPVVGLGTLEKLTLTIGQESLAGEIAVDFAKWPTDEDIAAAKEGEDPYAEAIVSEATGQSVTLVCGDAVELHPYNAQVVMFVVPAGVNITTNDVKLVATVDGKEFDATRHAKEIKDEKDIYYTRYNAKSGVGYEHGKGTPWSFGLEGKYVIDNDTDATNEYDDKLTAEERFLAYAYLTKPGQADVTDFTDYIYAAKALDLENVEDIATIEALVFADEINFAGLDKNWANAQAEAAHAAEYKAAAADKAKHLFWQAVYEWYAKEGAIESLSYNAVIGAPISGNTTAAIKNLKVVGTGISNGASLENLTFEAIEVTTESKDAVGLIAPSSAMKSTPNPQYGEETDMVIKNVIIAADNSVNAPNASIVGGIYGSFNDTNKIAAASAIEIKSAAKATHVGRLYGLIEGVSSNVSIELGGMAYGVHESVKDYAVVGRFQSTNVLIADIPAEASMLNGGIVKSTAGSTIVAGTSYWNGAIDSDDNPNNYGGSEYFTAEQFANALANNMVNTQYTLTNNIDMQCSAPVATIATEEETEEAVPGTGFDNASIVNAGQVLAHSVHTTNAGIYIDGTEEQFEIKNIIANAATKGQGLFGYNAKVSNLKLSNVTLFVDGAYSYIAGLAQTGTAENVIVNNLTINIAADAALDGSCKSIGGIFSEVDDVNDINIVEVNNFVVAYAGQENMGVRAGIIAGTLKVATTVDGVTLNPFTVGGDNRVINVAVGQGPLKNATTGIDGYVATNNYGTKYKSTKGEAYAFGTVQVTNAKFTANTKQKAVLNVASNWDTSKAFAAGVVFEKSFTNKAKGEVKYDGGEYAYSLFTNAPIGTYGYTSWGFSAK
ncbi:MAG: hypothetical protein IJ378_06105 [Alistipes sp.]|nr:hypothetical protein [Alistipes sp.]